MKREVDGHLTEMPDNRQLGQQGQTDVCSELTTRIAVARETLRKYGQEQIYDHERTIYAYGAVRSALEAILVELDN